MSRPNILIVMPDQQRADCLGCFGNPVIRTPNIDALAARGTRFTNAFVNHPVCGPSRVSMMTGWYPHTSGHRTLDNLVKPHEPNLLKYLKNAGYQVAWAGARGDVFAPGVTEDSTHFCGFTVQPSKMSMGPQFPPDSPLYDAFYHGKRPGETWLDFDEASTRTAIDWLNHTPAEPWCLWVPLLFPHLPFEAEDPWYSMYDPATMPDRIRGHGTGKPAFHAAIREKLGTTRLTEGDWQEIARVYYAMISRVDWQLGRIVSALKASGQYENTIVLYFTDHGEYLGDFGLVEKWPSGMDISLLQNPLIVAGPGIQEGVVNTGFAEMIDILPTLLDFAEAETSHTHFGHSLVPVLTGQQSAVRDIAYSEGGFVREDSHLLEQPGGAYRKKGELQHEKPEVVGKTICARNHDYTYVYRLYESDELYDRRADPQETCNLLTATPDHPQALEMKAAMMDWMVRCSDVIPWQSDPRFPKIPHGQHTAFSLDHDS
ncbi:MAG: sulfatase-like hydrolase/transferase [Pseudomonadales bacterium]|nr:sulfatase-like hydrolase/transferase [Pseudomonadales bacterium]